VVRSLGPDPGVGMPSSLRSIIRHRHAPALAVAVVGAVVYAAWQPPSNDFAVQHFRFELFRESPFAIWNNQWFAGHHTPAYSLLVPMLGSMLGAVLLGTMCAVVGAWLGSVLVHDLVDQQPDLRMPRLGGALLAVGLLVSLYGGRITFLLGAVLGIGALLASITAHWRTTAVCALFTTFASPVAGLFLVIIGASIVCARSLTVRHGLALVVPPLAAIGAVAVFFPEGGDFPFPWAGVINVLLVTAALAGFGWRYGVMRWLCFGYALVIVGTAVLTTPVGGNAARLAALAAPTALVMVARVALQWVAIMLVPLLALGWSPVSAMVTLDHAESEEEFYLPLIDVLTDLPAPLRVEVVPLATHGEADWVALQVPIARGWHRQLDRKYNSLFYGRSLSADQYLDWLQSLGVRYVAIADATLDSAGKLEEELLADPPSYLQLIHDDGLWRVFEVVAHTELIASGHAQLTELLTDSFRLHLDGDGPVVVRVRFSPWFRITEGAGCVRPNPLGWTVVQGPAGDVRVRASLSALAVLDHDGDC
jgi:hypothetical protein